MMAAPFVYFISILLFLFYDVPCANLLTNEKHVFLLRNRLPLLSLQCYMHA